MKSFFKSFEHAFSGLKKAITTERNLRFHLCIAFYVLLFSSFYSFSLAEYCILILSILSVISAELLNTGLEYLCDAVTTDYNRYINAAKNIGAAAVLVTSIGTFICAIILFSNLHTIYTIIQYFKQNIILLILLIASLFLSYYFVFCCFKTKKESYINV